MSTAPIIAAPARRERASSTLVRGAALTAVAAVLFPRLNAVLYDDEAIWQIDREAAVLIPVVVAVTLLLFAAVGGWARRGGGSRPARAALTCGILAIAGVVAFFVSAPIVLGGLAVTLGAEARGRGGAAVAAVVLGAIGIAAGAGIWLAGI